ncbi:hypothetical protein FOZ63_018341 [Perkinsus olseni]|uniref:Fe2OG dioxygenase domain-containing protein n=1 Tax=Perkinsus olseni TaxID=32597 RepID=A0A7J6UI19_PEROL|nr:hypothetical protein FOZ63_018341 [Perkinsus olseni]
MRMRYITEAILLAVGSHAVLEISYEVVQTAPTVDAVLQAATGQGSENASAAFLHKYGCPMATVEARRDVRSTLDRIGRSVAGILDEVLEVAYPIDRARSIKDIIDLGRDSHLDHHHIYRTSLSDDSETDANSTLPLHVDQGVFLLLVLPPGDTNFHYLDSVTFREVRLEVPDDGRTRVVVFFGSTLRDFTSTIPAVRPLPHSVRISPSPLAARVVIGRMFLLPPEAMSYRSSPPMTYRDWNQRAVALRSSDGGEVVEAKRRMEAACKDGEIYCWMQCMAADCAVGLHPTCYDPAKQESCDPNAMNPQCGVECRTEHASTPTVDPGAFCTGSTAMFMSGFTWSGSARNPCVILFTPSWVLDTPGKFAMGCIGVLLLGMLVEGLLAARRRYLGYVRRPLIRSLVGALAFGVSVSIAYLAMLVVMTYSCELFICLCVGLAIGHLLFANVKQEIGEAVDPCCGDTTVVRQQQQQQQQPSTGLTARHKKVDDDMDSLSESPVVGTPSGRQAF